MEQEKIDKAKKSFKIWLVVSCLDSMVTSVFAAYKLKLFPSPNANSEYIFLWSVSVAMIILVFYPWLLRIYKYAMEAKVKKLIYIERFFLFFYPFVIIGSFIQNLQNGFQMPTG